MAPNLKHHICLITGGRRGIGRAIAVAMAAAGARVAATATTAAGAEQITADLRAAGTPGLGLQLEVTDADSRARAVAAVTEHFGAPTVLVNNAGITRDNLLLRMADRDWDAVLATNLTAAAALSKICLRAMTRARYGKIIHIASVVGQSGNAGQTNYAAAKAGLIGFSKSLALEVAARNVTVNAIAPGFIETDMTAALSDSQRAELAAKIPLRRLGRPEDVAAAAVFLASAAADYITGATLPINGGLWMA